MYKITIVDTKDGKFHLVNGEDYTRMPLDEFLKLKNHLKGEHEYTLNFDLYSDINTGRRQPIYEYKTDKNILMESINKFNDAIRVSASSYDGSF